MMSYVHLQHNECGPTQPASKIALRMYHIRLGRPRRVYAEEM